MRFDAQRFLVSALHDWPGHGWPLIQATLRSPGVHLKLLSPARHLHAELRSVR